MNTQTVTLDVTKRRQVMPEIRIGQGDKDGTTLVANIYDNGEPFTLTNYTVRFAMRLPFDMAYYSVEGTVSGNTATFQIDESYAASVAGVTEVAYVEVLSGTTIICSTNRIRVVCLESAYENVDPAHLWDNGVEQFLEDAQDTLDAAVAQAQSDVSDAVDDADAATSRATQAAEAAEGVVLDAVPTMSPTLKGGAMLGSGLEIESDTLSIDLTDNATGESVTAADASYLASLTVDGKAVQDGTPTPSNPIDVQVVQGVNLAHGADKISPWSSSSKPALIIYNSADDAPLPSGALTISIVAEYLRFQANGSLFAVNKSNGVEYIVPSRFSFVPNTDYTGTYSTIIQNDASNPITSITMPYYTDSWANIDANSVCSVQLEKGSTATPYTPYGSIGLKVGSTITPINLNGNVLASLPDGTKDVLTVDSVGHMVMEKRVGKYDVDTLNWTDASSPSSHVFRTNIYGQISSSDYPVIPNGNVLPNAMMRKYARDTWAHISGSSNGSFALGISTATNQRFVIVDHNYSDSSLFAASLNGELLYYQLETPQTIDLGYIDMPAIPDGSQISITAQVTPTISASWWARGAAAIAEALKAVRARIDAIEAAIAELATA